MTSAPPQFTSHSASGCILRLSTNECAGNDPMTAGLAEHPGESPRRARVRSLLGRLRRDQSGVAAVQFAFVALPFMLLLFGIMVICLYFFTYFSLENAAWQ